VSLFGEKDRYLQKIESELRVQAVSRGNVVSFDGEGDAPELAREVLESLYQRLQKGLEVGMQEVDAAIRMAAGSKDACDQTEPLFGDDIVIKTYKKHISPYSNHQKEYIKTLFNKEMVFAIGPAGTGKTFLSVAVAVSMLMNHKVERIILCRPAVEAGEKIGFLPGDMKEKVDPYMQPLYDSLYDMIPAEKIEKYMENRIIEIAPLAFMRGRTLSRAFIILDEAQNATAAQMKMFLTRLGEGSRMVINGDLSQNDLPNNVQSGLADALDRLQNIDDIGVARFAREDIVRHKLVSKIVSAYD
jgi:phosphate starvation-inducible PhoH-like protein